MNLAEHAVSTLGGTGGTASRAPAGRWRVLFRGGPRPLLLRIGDYGLQKQWLPYFIGGGLKKFYADLLLKLSTLLPAMRLRPEYDLVRSSIEQFTRGAAGTAAAIQIGTAGPYQKASALLASEDGEGLALAKFALVPSADRMVEIEIAWLKGLEDILDMAGQVPRLLADGAVADGRRYLVTSLAASTRITTRFTPAHEEFLARLGPVRMEVMRYGASPCCAALERDLGEIESSLSPEEAVTLHGALGECRGALTGFVGPFVISHGDFVWWNIRVQPQGLFVFNWEYARAGGNPLADFLHFHLMPHAAAGRDIGRRQMASVLRRAQSFALRCYPGCRWSARSVAALALSYLLEVVFLHAHANGGLDRDGRVTRCYRDLMKRRPTWMAA